MKIGILTYHYVPNFGAQLQTLSTIGFIKKMGHTPILLHWQPYDLDLLYKNRVPEMQIQCHKKFADENFPLTSICRNENDLIKEIDKNNLDLIVTGSDALFKYVPQAKRKVFSKTKLRFVQRKVYCVEDVPRNPFFCDYYDRLKRKILVVAFSVSSQNCPYLSMNGKERSKIGSYIKNFKSITVRDEWTKNMVEFLIGKNDIKITPDPVFSFNQNCYIPIPKKERMLTKYDLPDNYVLISFWTDKVNMNYIHEIAKEIKNAGMTPVAFPMPEGLKDFGLEKKINLTLDPIEWYALIKYSSGYIGERMHPIVVCLHNAVPFFSFDEYGIVRRTFFVLKKNYNQQSSKTYHIVSNAGFVENLYAYNNKSPRPSSANVVDAIKTFDKNKCRIFAEKQQKSYLEAMKELLCRSDV